MNNETLILISKGNKVGISRNIENIDEIYKKLNIKIKTPFVIFKEKGFEHTFYSEEILDTYLDPQGVIFLNCNDLLNEIKKEPKHIQNIINHILIKHKLISETE